MDLKLQSAPQETPDNVPYFIEVDDKVTKDEYIIVMGSSFQISATGDLAVVDNMGHRLLGLRAGLWSSIFELRRDLEDVSPSFVTSPTEDVWLSGVLDDLLNSPDEIEEDED